MYKTMEADEDKQPHQGDVDGVSMLNLDAVPGRTQAGKHQKWKVAQLLGGAEARGVFVGADAFGHLPDARCSWFILILISFDEWTKKQFDKSSLYVQNDVANKLLSKQWIMKLSQRSQP